jgi:membrane protease subunit (stomatin/prohibitin family)
MLLARETRTMRERWGTRSQLAVEDAAGNGWRLRGHGEFTFRVADATRLVESLEGELGCRRTAQVMNFLRDVIAERLGIEIGKVLAASADLRTGMAAVQRAARRHLEHDFADKGLELLELEVQTLLLPDAARGQIVDLPSSGEETTGGTAPPTPQRKTRIEFASEAEVGSLLPRINVQTLPAAEAGQEPELHARPETRDAPHPPAPTITCSGCGDDAPREAKFCPWCGKRLGEPA